MKLFEYLARRKRIKLTHILNMAEIKVVCEERSKQQNIKKPTK